MSRPVAILHAFRYALVGLFFLMGWVSSASAASCTNNGTGHDYTIDMGTRSVPRDTVVGTNVGPRIAPTPTVEYAISCTPDPAQDRDVTLTFTVSTSVVTGYTDVYPTNVAGVGIQYYFRGDGCGVVRDALETTIQRSTWVLSCHLPAGTAAIRIFVTGSSTAIIKTGPITAGLLTSIPAVTASYQLNNQAGTFALSPMYAGTATGNFVVQTCATPDVTIPMGAVPISTFAGPGVATSPWVKRNININNCPSNMNQVSIRFNTPVAGWLDAANKVFKLNNPTAPATAQGVGIQMSFGDNDAIAPYDAYQPLSGYDAIKNNGGSFTVSIGGRYYKPASSSSISPGSANGTVIFDMLYQ